MFFSNVEIPIIVGALLLASKAYHCCRIDDEWKFCDVLFLFYGDRYCHCRHLFFGKFAVNETVLLSNETGKSPNRLSSPSDLSRKNTILSEPPSLGYIRMQLLFVVAVLSATVLYILGEDRNDLPSHHFDWTECPLFVHFQCQMQFILLSASAHFGFRQCHFFGFHCRCRWKSLPYVSSRGRLVRFGAKESVLRQRKVLYGVFCARMVHQFNGSVQTIGWLNDSTHTIQ